MNVDELAICFNPNLDAYRIERLSDAALRARVAADVGWYEGTNSGWLLVGSARSPHEALDFVSRHRAIRVESKNSLGNSVLQVVRVEIFLRIDLTSRREGHSHKGINP